ncbi:hypothetical protein BDE36_3873 [Arcticibacter tournemirensis]|uniref:ATP-binding protein n=1 Tax=Arcticibacter tournemirensis TaxID=699437 RepID=A0A5M9HLD1_9SPHI|nr:AAA family ATPase [Arcticibacter tournemirensis]KAA8486271.1 ATP-binding protein [Arcticibacter tournemirensis]TQM52075.1 hypothetical protein BDE36_3873 [Arcticibacter tournemirensis]
MEKLKEKYYKKIDNIPLRFTRYLMKKIDWSNRIIGIKGARGAGKTTFLLQYIRLYLPQDNKTLYVSLDDLYFTENKLIDFADTFVKQGGEYLLLDEVHRYPNWSQEIKNIYDDHPDLKVIFTGSSILHIDKARGDLSRRAVMYELSGLSFREFINYTTDANLEAVELKELLSNHTSIARSIVKKLRPLEHFQNYLRYGYYPYFAENINLYPQKLAETISLALSTDLPAMYEISNASIEKMRLLLYILAESVPFKPNISKLSERIGISRNSLLNFLRYLEDMRVIRSVYSSIHGIGLLQKPEKIYLYHPNIHYALASNDSNVGNIRECFFLNQVQTTEKITYPSEGDFKVDDLVFEIGGKGKNTKQVKHMQDYRIVSDDIEIGSDIKIPLWLFGFLY